MHPRWIEGERDLLAYQDIHGSRCRDGCVRMDGWMDGCREEEEEEEEDGEKKRKRKNIKVQLLYFIFFFSKSLPPWPLSRPLSPA